MMPLISALDHTDPLQSEASTMRVFFEMMGKGIVLGCYPYPTNRISKHYEK